MDEGKLKYIIGVLFVMLMGVAWMAKDREERDQYDANVCAGPPLRSAAEREQAQVDGYVIHMSWGCITKESFEAITRERERALARKAMSTEMQQTSTPKASDETVQSLTAARRGLKTEIAARTESPLPIPEPPPELFVRSDYRNPQGILLPAFVTPDPRDGEKHAAIVWLTGGDSNSLDDFWTPGTEANDQSVSAFRKAGVIMMFPTLRGGNNQESGKEFFFGEVDDVLAAADHLASLRYVDASRIYLGGHSTGGTLALLTVESSRRFAATFAFGPVATVDRYPDSIFPIRYRQLGDYELKLRSPKYWIHDIGSPTYIIEGASGSSNIDELELLCGQPSKHLHCIAVPDHDHFSVLTRVTRTLAARVAFPSGAAALLKQEEFQN